MATVFPVTIPTPRTNPNGTDALSSPPHHTQHTDVNDEVTALMAKVGVNGSAITTSLDYKNAQHLGRNKIINGNCAVAQRGNGAFTTAAYTYGIDQWSNNGNGSSASVTRTAFTAAEIPGVAEAGFYFKNVVTGVVGAGNYVFARHFIEDVDTLAGQTATLSYYAKASAALYMSPEVYQSFGTGGAPSADVSTPITKQLLTTSWARYTHTFTVPSISGKTVGTTANTSYLQISLWFDGGSSYNSRHSTLGSQSGTFSIWGLQLEAGANATPFEREHVSVTMAKCQRYLQACTGFVGPTASASTTLSYVCWPMKANFRVTPTLPTAGTGWSVYEAGAAVAVTALAINGTSTANAVFIDCTVASGLTAGRAGVLINGTTALLSAEL